MSYTQVSGQAVFTLPQSEDDILTHLAKSYDPELEPVFDDEDDLKDYLSGYISVQEDSGQFLISLDSEQHYCNHEVFEFITTCLAKLQGIDVLTLVEYSSYDSREGSSSNTVYLNNKGEEVDPVADSAALNQIQRIMSGSEWDSDAMQRIADVLRNTGRAVDDLT